MHVMTQEAADLLAACVTVLVAVAGISAGVGLIAGLVREAMTSDG